MTELPQHNTTVLKVYLYFRTALAFLLAGMFLLTPSSNVLGTLYPDIFFWICLGYAAICISTILTSPAHKLSHSFNRIVGSLIIDVLAVLLMLHASGGIESGLGYLLVVFVAIGGIVIRGQLAIAYAAMASLMLMAETLYLSQMNESNSKLIFSAGSLGILLFGTAYAFQFFTEKIRASNIEAEAQAQFAEHLQRLAQAIVARMRTGIIVVDTRGRIELINDSALQLLDLPADADYRGIHLNAVSPLHPVMQAWTVNPLGAPPQLHELRGGLQARISLSVLELGASSRTVIYLEDHRVMTQQAQQLKLASLGRLTASIAHEVRNPLGAISHAAQLLAESPELASGDKRLTEIIYQHSQRVNQIVESTLALSRRKEPQAETLNLNLWLPKFIGQYRIGQDVDIRMSIGEGEHLVKIDPTHLSQILTNLFDNGLRYSRLQTGAAKITVAINKSENDDTSYLETIDYGPGIDEQQAAHIFDPFFTTEEQGSGLGLYISKELCEINQATLHYHKPEDGSSCFRIDFSHYQRMF